MCANEAEAQGTADFPCGSLSQLPGESSSPFPLSLLCPRTHREACLLLTFPLHWESSLFAFIFLHMHIYCTRAQMATWVLLVRTCEMKNHDFGASQRWFKWNI